MLVRDRKAILFQGIRFWLNPFISINDLRSKRRRDRARSGSVREKGGRTVVVVIETASFIQF